MWRAVEGVDTLKMMPNHPSENSSVFHVTGNKVQVSLKGHRQNQQRSPNGSTVPEGDTKQGNVS